MNIYFLLNFRILLRIFILSIICLLLDGVYYFYYNKIMEFFGILNYGAKTGYNPIIWDENGLVETVQVLFLLSSIILILLFIKSEFSRLNSFEKLLIFIYFVGIIYYLFEEISWGQHIFTWESSSFFLENNHQKETNLHNISSLFNELPRNLLFLWCSLTFLWINKFSFKGQFLNKFIFPNKNLKYISFLILFFFIPDFLVNKLDIISFIMADNDKDIAIKTFFHLITFNFVRLSELEELLFNFYIVSHSFYLFKVKL